MSDTGLCESQVLHCIQIAYFCSESTEDVFNVQGRLALFKHVTHYDSLLYLINMYCLIRVPIGSFWSRDMRLFLTV